MKLYRLISVFLLTTAFSAVTALAQKDSTKLNQSVEVMKAYRPSISNANKVNLMPAIDDTPVLPPSLNIRLIVTLLKQGLQPLQLVLPM